MKDFISLENVSRKELMQLLKLALSIKKNPRKFRKTLNSKVVGLIFQKPSLRTKSAFYIGALQLGAGAVYYAPNEVKIGEREKVSDIARTLSPYLDAVVLRTFMHTVIEEFAKYAKVSVINGLSDLTHPSQALADMLTILECKGRIDKVKIAYLGDGNNVCHSLMHSVALLGSNLAIATPLQNQPNEDIFKKAQVLASQSKAKIELFNSPEPAVKDADVIYTDVWTSMGNEDQEEIRKNLFKDFQVNGKVLSLAKKDCVVMHCLPAHRGQEITDEVIDGKNSVVFQQAENRLHTAKAILLYLLK